MILSQQKLSHHLSELFSCSPDALQLKRLGGYNNTNYKATVLHQSYFVKVANREEKLVGSSLKNEVNCLALLKNENIGPKVINYDPCENIMVTEFVGSGFAFNEGRDKKRYIALLRHLHQIKFNFPNKTCPMEMIKRYAALVQEKGIDLPKSLKSEILPKLYSLNKETLFIGNAPCHFDPQLANVVDDGQNLYFVDWEFAAMSDPLFDLASLCASEHFSDSEMEEILTLYLDTPFSKNEWDQFFKIRIIADMRMCLFCYLYTAITSNREAQYRGFSEFFLGQAHLRLSMLD